MIVPRPLAAKSSFLHIISNYHNKLWGKRRSWPSLNETNGDAAIISIAKAIVQLLLWATGAENLFGHLS